MKAMWETKVVPGKKAASSPAVEIEGGRNKLKEAKAVFASSSTPKSPAVRQRRRMSFEKEQTESGEAENLDSENRKVNSMRSMWENKKETQHSKTNANEEDAFDASIVGRLKGTKAMFENMSKQNQRATSTEFKSQLNDGTTSPKTSSTPVHDVKSLFENKSRGQQSPPSSSTKRSKSALVSK